MLQGLSTPIAPNADPAATAADLEPARLRVLQGAASIAATQCQLEATVREYNSAHGFTPVPNQPSWLDEVRRRGGGLGGELGHDGEPATPPGFRRPVYSSPVKNMKATQAAAAEMAGLEGEELRQQQRRVQDLLAAANQQ